jgi:hypothetical protein
VKTGRIQYFYKMKNYIAKILYASGLLLFFLGFVIDYNHFSSTSHRIHPVTDNHIDGFRLKIIGFLVFLMGMVVYYGKMVKITTNPIEIFKKVRDMEKLMNPIRKNKK